MISKSEYKNLQSKAQTAARYAVKTGKLPTAIGQDCVDCGKPAIGYDHRDYTKPLEVDPICKGCNTRRGAAYPFYDGYSVKEVKSKSVAFRLQKYTDEKLKRLCEIHNMNTSNLIAKLIMGAK